LVLKANLFYRRKKKCYNKMDAQ